MIKVILFDLDGVIFDFKKTEKHAIEKTFQHYQIPIDASMIAYYHQLNDSMWKKFEQNQLTKDEVTFGRFKIFLEHYGYDIDAVRFAADFQNALASGYYLYDDAYDILETLSKDYRLFAVTNGVSRTAYKRLDGTNTSQFFENVFVSEDLHAQKPSLEYFRQVMDAIEDFNPNEAILVGDSLTSDIQGAKNIHVYSVYLNRQHVKNETTIIPDKEIDRLDNLYEVLKEVNSL